VSGPRNYFERGERRRLLWRFMPAALALLLGLTVIERIWFPVRRQPAAPPIDTALDAVRGRPPQGDEVVIEAEPEPFVPEADDLSADARSLGLVRDDTFFREADAAVQLRDFLAGFVKTFFFAILVGGIGCLRGLQTKAGASAVGESATSAVVSCIIMLVVVDGLFALAYYLLNF